MSSTTTSIEAVSTSVKEIPKRSVFTRIQFDAIKRSICMNYIFYITSVVCILGLSYVSNVSAIQMFVTFIFVSWFGYVAHAMAHLDCIREMVAQMLRHFNIGQGSTGWLDYIATKSIRFYEFHEDVHHDTNVNKRWFNVCIEAAGNFGFQAGFLLAMKYMLQYLDTSILVLWGIGYATVHNINYNLYPSPAHMKHHINKHTNYGIDIWDIMFGTKYQDDLTDIENINHYSINMIVLTLLIAGWMYWRRSK